MNVKSISAGTILLSAPTTMNEKIFLENTDTASTQGFQSGEVTFKVSCMKDGNDNITHLQLSLIIPDEFEDDLTGQGVVVRKESRCQYCGGADH